MGMASCTCKRRVGALGVETSRECTGSVIEPYRKEKWRRAT